MLEINSIAIDIYNNVCNEWGGLDWTGIKVFVEEVYYIISEEDREYLYRSIPLIKHHVSKVTKDYREKEPVVEKHGNKVKYSNMSHQQQIDLVKKIQGKNNDTASKN